MTTVTTPRCFWRGTNLHECLQRFQIHSMTEEDHLLDHASLGSDYNIEVLRKIVEELEDARA